MASAGTVPCPYCNGIVSMPGGTAPGRRLECPRCGETFAYMSRDADRAAIARERTANASPGFYTAQPPKVDPTAVDTFRTNARVLLHILLVMGVVLLIVGSAYINSLLANGTAFDVAVFAGVAVPLLVLLLAVGGGALAWLWFFRVRRSNRATSLFVVANMVTLALLSLGGALATQGYRRQIDRGLPARPKRSPVVEEVVATPVAPAHLAALGYLPPKTDLVAGIHVAELLDGRTGQVLLEQPLQFGNAEVRLAELAAKIGLDVKKIDHVVVGMRSDELLSAVFVFRMRQPYDALNVRETLHARVLPGTAKDRTFYQVTLPQGSLTALLWCADEQTLLLALARESLEKATIPRDGTPDPLLPELRALLSERVRPVAQLWAAGCSADWSKTAAVLLLARMPEDWQDRLVAVRTFGLWAVVDQAVTLNGVARFDDTKALDRFDEWLVGRANPEKPPTMVRDGNWLSLQRRLAPDAFRSLFAP